MGTLFASVGIIFGHVSSSSEVVACRVACGGITHVRDVAFGGWWCKVGSVSLVPGIAAGNPSFDVKRKVAPWISSPDFGRDGHCSEGKPSIHLVLSRVVGPAGAGAGTRAFGWVLGRITGCEPAMGGERGVLISGEDECFVSQCLG